MTRAYSNDLDYLTARLHARRSRMAEADALDELCRVHTLPELGHAVLPGVEFSDTREFQRLLVHRLVREISGCLKHLDKDAHDLMAWLLMRFELEDIKVLLRGFLNHIPVEILQPYFVTGLSGKPADHTFLMAAKSIDEFVDWLPAEVMRHTLHALLAAQRETPPLFILEAALDYDYFRELTVRNNRLRHGEAEIGKPLVVQEINIFQFMLVARGRFHFGLPAETLLPLCLNRKGAGSDWIGSLFSAADLLTMVKLAAGMVIDEEPEAVELPAIESMAWQRYRRLANLAFRRSHMGAAAVAGYFGLRRIEIGNLIRVSEGIRLAAGDDAIRKRMIPHMNLEGAYV